jgi:hypothetical protein
MVIVLGSNAVERRIKVHNRICNGYNGRADVVDVIDLFRLLASLSVHPTKRPSFHLSAFVRLDVACVRLLLCSLLPLALMCAYALARVQSPLK